MLYSTVARFWDVIQLLRVGRGSRGKLQNSAGGLRSRDSGGASVSFLEFQCFGESADNVVSKESRVLLDLIL